MSEDIQPTTSADQRRAILKDFLSQKTPDIRIEDQPQENIKQSEPSLIVQANADGSLKPEPPPQGDEVQFRAYPDGTFCKFSEIKDRAGFIAICLNTSKPGQPDVLHQVGIVKSRAVADLLCDGLNCMMQVKVMERQARVAAHEEANDLACDVLEMPALAEAHNPETT